jgi:hypothetical protein
MDWKELAGEIAGIAEKVLPAVVPGAGPAIAIATEVISLGRAVTRHVPAGTGTGDLEANLDKLEAAVMAHADRTAESLGDGPT